MSTTLPKPVITAKGPIASRNASRSIPPKAPVPAVELLFPFIRVTPRYDDYFLRRIWDLYHYVNNSIIMCTLAKPRFISKLEHASA